MSLGSCQGNTLDIARDQALTASPPARPLRTDAKANQAWHSNWRIMGTSRPGFTFDPWRSLSVNVHAYALTKCSVRTVSSAWSLTHKKSTLAVVRAAPCPPPPSSILVSLTEESYHNVTVLVSELRFIAPCAFKLRKIDIVMQSISWILGRNHLTINYFLVTNGCK
jgi:hypothetical protein